MYLLHTGELEEFIRSAQGRVRRLILSVKPRTAERCSPQRACQVTIQPHRIEVEGRSRDNVLDVEHQILKVIDLGWQFITVLKSTHGPPWLAVRSQYRGLTEFITCRASYRFKIAHRLIQREMEIQRREMQKNCDELVASAV